MPVPPDLTAMANELAEYTPEEMAELKALGEAGMESDIIEASVRTLIYLLPRVKNPHRPGQAEKEIALFSGVVRQLEDILSYLLQKKDYDLATEIIKAFHLPVDPTFKPRMREALKKTASRASIVSAIADLRKYRQGLSRIPSGYAYRVRCRAGGDGSPAGAPGRGTGPGGAVVLTSIS